MISIKGANINLIGEREPRIYGEEKMEETHKRLKVCIFEIFEFKGYF